jgi:hypothetical protein
MEMNWSRLKLPLLALLVLVLASYVVFLEVEASEESDDEIGSSAVWNPSANDLAQIQKICGAQGSGYSRCFIEQMSKFGAPPDAISFTQTYADQNQGTLAVLQGFRPLDGVDFGYAFFPGGADFNRGWLLVNGNPEIVNVDNINLLPQTDMQHDWAFGALQARYPHVTLFDGDRSDGDVPPMETLPDGGQRFSVNYPLKDQCRACAEVGRATFAFSFDATGRLTGVKFVNITTDAPATTNAAK